MKVRCINTYYGKVQYYDIIQGQIYDAVPGKHDSGVIINKCKYPWNCFELVNEPPLTPLQYWAETLNGLMAGDRFQLKTLSGNKFLPEYFYDGKKIEGITNYFTRADFFNILINNLTAEKLPKVHSIIIDDKTIELSEESFKALKQSLKED